MTWVRAGASDGPQIAAFLDKHIDTSMFAAGNLQRYGMDSAAPLATRFWMQQRQDRLAGVIGVTNAGMILPQAPVAGPADWAVFAAYCPTPLIGCIGPTEQVRPCLAALGLTGASMQLDKDEPRFALSLVDLLMPDGPALQLDPLTAADQDLFVDWRSAYDVETLGGRMARARDKATEEFPQRLIEDNIRLLRSGSQAVAMTGFNAQLPGIVQIGGVYTPPDLRGRGYARRAVALHLAQAQTAGVTRAVLFAANAAAVRAYQAIGFKQTGQFTLTLFAGPEVPRPQAAPHV